MIMKSFYDNILVNRVYSIDCYVERAHGTEANMYLYLVPSRLYTRMLYVYMYRYWLYVTYVHIVAQPKI